MHENKVGTKYVNTYILKYISLIVKYKCKDSCL
jgi:hypothetical protein